MITTILAKVFEFFKTKSPVFYSIFLGIIGLVWIANGQGWINLPQIVVDTLIALGLVTGTHTTAIIKSDK